MGIGDRYGVAQQLSVEYVSGHRMDANIVVRYITHLAKVKGKAKKSSRWKKAFRFYCLLAFVFLLRFVSILDKTYFAISLSASSSPTRTHAQPEKQTNKKRVSPSPFPSASLSAPFVCVSGDKYLIKYNTFIC